MPSQDSDSPHALSYTTVSRQALVNEGQQPRYPPTIQPSEGRNDGPTSQSSSSIPRIPSRMDILLSSLGLFRTESAGRHILPISTDHQRSQSPPWSKFIEITNPIIQVLGFVFATLFGAWAIKSYYISTEALKQSSLANQLAILSFCQGDQSSQECSVVLEKGLPSVINAIIPLPATLLGTAPVITATPDIPPLLSITPTLPPPPFFTTPVSIIPPSPTPSSVPTLSVPLTSSSPTTTSPVSTLPVPFFTAAYLILPQSSFTSSILPPPVTLPILPPPSTTSSVSTLSVPSFTSSILPLQVVNQRINIPRPFNSNIPQSFNCSISQPFKIWDISWPILPSPLITAPLVPIVVTTSLPAQPTTDRNADPSYPNYLSLGLVGLIAIIVCLDFVRRKSARDVSQDVKASAGLIWDAVEGSSTTHSKHLKIRSSQTFLRNRSSKHAK